MNIHNIEANAVKEVIDLEFFLNFFSKYVPVTVSDTKMNRNPYISI